MRYADTIAALQRQIDELREELKRHEERTEAMSADEMVRRARQFIINNPKAWNIAIDYAKEQTAKRRRFNMQGILEEWRKADYIEVWEDFKSNNSLAAPLGRELVEAYPPAEKYLPLRRSKTDRFYPFRRRHDD